MKILITSDIHGNIENLKKVKAKYPNYKHLDAGDSVISNDLLLSSNIASVKGNCDYNNNLEFKKLINYKSKKIMITHGHLYNVKIGINKLVNDAVKNNVDYLIFGHTHRPLIKKYESLNIINPGSLNEGSYVIIEDDKILLKVV